MAIKQKIFEAIDQENAIDLERAIEAGCNVNEKNIEVSNYTPLQYAAIKNSYDCASVLIKAGADIEARNDVGNTALMEACANNGIEVVSLLIHSGAKLDCKNANGFTATMLAAKAGYAYCVDGMTRSGADLNLRNDAGRTAFDEAVDAESSVTEKVEGANYRATVQHLSENMESVPKLVTLLYEVGAPFFNTQEIFDEIYNEFGKAVTSEHRSRLLGTLVTVMDVVMPTVPADKVEKIKEANRQIYHTYLLQESTVGENVCVETLYEVTNREIQAGRMSEDNSIRKIALDAIAEPHYSRADLIAIRDAKTLQPEPQQQKKSIWRKLFGG